MQRLITRFILLFICLLCTPPHAISKEKERDDDALTAVAPTYYIEIEVSRTTAGKTTAITVNPGKILPLTLGLNESTVKRAFYDRKFSTEIDALNFFGDRGWKLADSYTVTSPGKVVTHLILSAECNDVKLLIENLLR